MEFVAIVLVGGLLWVLGVGCVVVLEFVVVVVVVGGLGLGFG